MADFVAVLRKTIGNLGDNSPEMREKVYEKARSTIEAKLAAITPPPPVVVVDRQRKALEDAIAVVRADFAEPEAPIADDELEDIFASLHAAPDLVPPPVEEKPAPFVAAPGIAAAVPVAPIAPTAPVAEPEPEPEPEPQPQPQPQPSAPSFDDVINRSKPDPVLDEIEDEPVPAVPVAAATATAVSVESIDTLLADAPKREPKAEAKEQRPRKVKPIRDTSGASSKRTGIAIAALVVLAIAAVAAYSLWPSSDTPVASQPTPTTSQQAAETTVPPATTADELPAEQDVVAAPAPAAEEPAAATPPATSEKFTQRLMADGGEVDEGPAGGRPTIGEGTSVSTIEQPEPGATPAEPIAPSTSTAQTAPAEQAQPAPQSGVAVGQRAIFYEERTSSTQGSAELGSIVWSVVQESPGGDMPAEPAIRAEATIPGKDVQLRMTIRRNGDSTLPASHIVEMIFLTPEGFEGGAIANVSRISFKETEQAAGSPLIGIPAKIADGFFLIALGDGPAEIQTNTTLLRQQSWIDIPIVYQSGRRALLSLEKGLPGEKVFQDALRAWEQATAG